MAKRPIMKKASVGKMPNMPKKGKNNTTGIIIGVTVLVAVGGAAYWYFNRKKKEEDQLELVIGGAPVSRNTPRRTNPNISTPTITTPPRRTRFRCTNSGYPLAYGTCNEGVKVLQRYLKIYNEDLGTTGPGKDGVDGMFGSKTARAAKKRLNKVSFTQKDIKGMKTSLKMMKR